MRQITQLLILVATAIELLACSVPTVTSILPPTPTRTPRPTYTPKAAISSTVIAVNVPAATISPPTMALPTTTAQFTRTTTRPSSATPRVPAATASRAVVVLPQPPLSGGTWDFEGGWRDTPSGFEGRVDCVADDWKFFRRRGQFGQPTFNKNKNPVNVHRGARSQEIAFESSDGEAGIYRRITVISNHRYTISAWGIHYPSPSPIELYLGIDLMGGENYQAATVQWFPWNATADAQWLHTQATVRATGTSMTIFLKAVHRVAAGGGATLFDDVSVTDLGE